MNAPLHDGHSVRPATRESSGRTAPQCGQGIVVDAAGCPAVPEEAGGTPALPGAAVARHFLRARSQASEARPASDARTETRIVAGPERSSPTEASTARYVAIPASNSSGRACGGVGSRSAEGPPARAEGNAAPGSGARSVSFSSTQPENGPRRTWIQPSIEPQASSEVPDGNPTFASPNGVRVISTTGHRTTTGSPPAGAAATKNPAPSTKSMPRRRRADGLLGFTVRRVGE